MGEDKEYEVEAVFGGVSDTYDAEGKITLTTKEVELYKKDIENALKSFRGKVKQTPPSYSAIKVKGQPAYKRVRRGEKVELKPREIEVYSFKLLSFKKKRQVTAKFTVKCSSGTYIRSLIHDLGKKLKVGAYVKELKRVKVGEFSIKAAKKVEKINTKTKLIPMIIPMKGYKTLNLTDEDFENVKNGRPIEPKRRFAKDEIVIGKYKNEIKSILVQNKQLLKIKKNL